MASYLAQHPEVFVSNPKEPLYFLHPLAKNRKIVDESHYLSLFKRAAGYTAIGEASVWYLYSDHARKAIYEFNPKARIIVIMRNPVDFVASLHSQQVFGGHENEKNLAYAWHREKNNVLDGSEETIERYPNWRGMYAELMRHGKYLARYIETFGEENVFVLTQEQMLRDMRGAYVQILTFLGVEDDGRIYFPKVNANKAHKSEMVRRLLTIINKQQWAIQFSRKIKSILGVGSFGLYAALRNANIEKSHRSDVPDYISKEIETRAAELARYRNLG